jgi:hypothetical protein
MAINKIVFFLFCKTFHKPNITLEGERSNLATQAGLRSKET